MQTEGLNAAAPGPAADTKDVYIGRRGWEQGKSWNPVHSLDEKHFTTMDPGARNVQFGAYHIYEELWVTHVFLAGEPQKMPTKPQMWHKLSTWLQSNLYFFSRKLNILKE